MFKPLFSICSHKIDFHFKTNFMLHNLLHVILHEIEEKAKDDRKMEEWREKRSNEKNQITSYRTIPETTVKNDKPTVKKKKEFSFKEFWWSLSSALTLGLGVIIGLALIVLFLYVLHGIDEAIFGD